MLYLLIFSFITLVRSDGISDITASLLRGHTGDTVAAYGDFNADKLTDIFVLTQSDKQSEQLELLFAHESHNDQYERVVLLNSTAVKAHKIHSVVPGDFDGDAQMDVLITTKDDKDKVNVFIYWGKDGDTLEQDPYEIKLNGQPVSLNDQPLVMDWDADMIPDIFGEGEDGNRYVWLNTEGKRNFTSQKIENKTRDKLRAISSHAFVDLNHDYAADLLLTVEDGFEIWYNVKGELTYNRTMKPPPLDEIAYIGQSTFIDMDQNSSPDHLLPVCVDEKCEDSRIYVHSDGMGPSSWVELVGREKLKIEDKVYLGFVPPSENPGKAVSGLDFPITIRTGDFDMDGFPDAVVILKKTESEKPTSQAYILKNVACTGNEHCVNNRTFVVWDTMLSDYADAVLVTYFDIFEDGILDIFLVVKSTENKGKDAGSELQLRAFKNTISADANFIKITVVSGKCGYNGCENGRKPIGVNQPGPAVKYETTKPNGAPTQGCATQLSQSAHFALQLPFSIFGLGAMPNFVDELTVGMPTPKDATIDKPLKKTWPQIIPNSQLIVIPYPLDKPNSWNMKLYVTPSEAIMITGAVLVGTLGLTSIIVGGLHWRERREDKEEKKQEAQKFHFDAM